jgi:hypothetical protein
MEVTHMAGNRPPVEEEGRVAVTGRRVEDRPIDAQRERAEARVGVELPETFNLREDRARWGPVWAGFLTAITTTILLSLLGVAVGLTAVNPGAATTPGAAPPPGSGTAAAIWGAITGIVAFFLGGWVASRMSAVFNRKWGAWNGALVFMLAVPITLFLVGQGLGMVMGTLGSFMASLGVNPASLASAAPSVPPDQAVQAARSAAWSALIGMLLALGAAALGGYFGTRREIPLDETVGGITAR